MKKTKMIVSLMLTLVMLLAMAIPAFAVEGAPAETPKGTITITSPVAGANYNVYKMLDLSLSADGKAYSYTVTPAWESFIKNAKTAEGETGKNYFTVDETTKIVTFNDGISTETNSAEMVKLAKDALAHVKAVNSDTDDTNNIPVAATLNTENATANVALGYYLVDSGSGALCSLTTTDTEAVVGDKNGTPSVEKKVDKVTASYGEVVTFTSTITVATGAENYILHDTMQSTFGAFDKNTIAVTVDNATVAPEKYEVSAPGTEEAPATKCTFDIKFKDDYIKTLTAGTKIVVTYSAKLDPSAVPGNANVNKTWVTYGRDNIKTEESQTETKTYSFDLVKTKIGENDVHTVLDGAEFELYASKTGTDKICIVENADGTYSVATDKTDGANGFTSAKIKAGNVTIKGLGNGTYWLKETKQPEGYNILADRVEVKIENTNRTAVVTENEDKTVKTYTSGGVEVINYTGTELPSTGGVGTTIFYIVGGVLLVGAGLALVVRRRMNAK